MRLVLLKEYGDPFNFFGHEFDAICFSTGDIGSLDRVPNLVLHPCMLFAFWVSRVCGTCVMLLWIWVLWVGQNRRCEIFRCLGQGQNILR